MSGHSKWSTIKRQKGAADIKRGLAFTKLSNAITVAVKQGGGVGDPNSNFHLRLAIDAARAANMPKDNIERAIQRAAGKANVDVEEIVYEGFGPGGFSIIVEAITDNKQRTTPIVKSAFEKNGGSIGTPGSVSYQFHQAGQITVEKNGKSFDDIFNLAVESGAEDVEDALEVVLVYTKPEELAVVRDGMQKAGVAIQKAELVRKPIHHLQIVDRESAKRALAFMEKIEDLEDIQQVYANFDIPEEVLA